MYHEYPYTTYYNDIDKLCKCLKALNIYLDTHGDYLRLINGKNNEVMSSVKVSYAEKALTDYEGKDIRTYLVSAGTNGTNLVFTKGNNEVISFEVPFAKTAAKDVQNKDILDYVYDVSISGNKVRITNGDGTVYELTVPFATAAAETVDGYDLTMLACELATDGNELVLKDTKGNELSRITPNFAIKAQKDVDGDDIKSTYANSMTQTATTLKLLAKDGTVLDEETINYATTSLKDTDGNLFLSDYAEKIVVDGDGKRIGVEAHDGTRLATITVPFATLATDASNAVENIQVSGDQIIFTTYAGQTFAITAPYAVKAQKDDNGNTIKTTYVADVSNDTDAGTITFYDSLGNELVTIHNGVITHAIYDNYDNPIAGYIKTLAATAGSDYITATHGDGTVDSIKVDYSERALKDTNGNVIKNTYVKRLAIAQDPDDNQWKLFAFNGDTPEALLFALVITAEQAYKDVNGKLLTSYVADGNLNGTDLILQDGTNNIVRSIDLSSLGKTYELSNNVSYISDLDVSAPVVQLTDGNGLTSVAKFVDFKSDALDLNMIKQGDTVVWEKNDGTNPTLSAGSYDFYYGKYQLGNVGQALQNLNANYNDYSGVLYVNGSNGQNAYDMLSRINGIPSICHNLPAGIRLPMTSVTEDLRSSVVNNDRDLTKAVDTALAFRDYDINLYRSNYSFGYEIVVHVDIIAPTAMYNYMQLYVTFRNTKLTIGSGTTIPNDPY